ncbi:hypothetical protein C8R45DRAFT_926497 [Mycena sanguinolenta]|nr:hypothetical protein C8R45DRAFT_926497 [Mycena sanguinolenta]
MDPPPPQVPPNEDPNIHLLHNCPECHAPMGPLHVNKGTSHRASRGRLGQKCKGCHKSQSHTAAYEFSDAENLLIQINARERGWAIPEAFWNTPLRFVPERPEADGPLNLPRPVAGPSLSQAPQGSGRARALAQPMSMTWVSKRAEENNTVETGKTAHQRLDQQVTAELVIYRSQDRSPLTLHLPAPSFPQMNLSSSLDIMRDLKPSSASWVDIYMASEWKTLQASTTFEVNKHLLEEIPLENCPDVDHYLLQQPQKRTGSALLVPPPQSMPHTDNVPRAFTPAPTIPDLSFFPAPIIPNNMLIPTPVVLQPTLPKVDGFVRHYPESYSVAEHDRAWGMFHEQQTRRKLGREQMWPQMFPGSKFVKTTVGLWQPFYKNAPLAIRDHFIVLGTAGSWDDFRAAVTAYNKDHHLPAFLTNPAVNITPSSVEPSTSNDDILCTPTPIAAVVTRPLPQPSTPASFHGLCDFWDEPYKVAPSAKLLQLRSQLLPISTPASNFINPAHRIIHSATRLAAYCKQHDIDATLMPAAHANGWPEYINFGDLVERTQKLISDLQDIVEAINCSPFFEAATEFKKATAYFGEIGYRVIEHIIHQIFPEATIQIDCSPLSWDQALERVLVPEVLTLLIAQELNMEAEDAIAVIQDSTPFGLAYHSDPDNRDRSAAKFHELPAPFPALSPCSSPIPSPPLPPPQLDIRIDSPAPPPIDPSSLCNFCDEELPSELSEDLLAMGKAVFRKSWVQPLLQNQLHRALPVITMAADYFRQGWPLKLEFVQLFHRIFDLRLSLRALIYKRGLNSSLFFTEAREYYGSQVSKLSSLSSQYLNKRESEHGTGYYGECGYQLIYPTLQFLFPESPDLLEALHPLTYDILLREILIPETTIRLIQDDLHVSPENVIGILKSSHNFGPALHPADDNCPIYERALNCIADSHCRAEWALSIYESSGSDLPFDMWLQKQKVTKETAKVKTEPKEGKLVWAKTSEIIDLTLEDH